MANYQVRRLALYMMLAATASFSSYGDDFKYVGVEGCGCHAREIGLWKVGPHAKAFTSLMPSKRKAVKRNAGIDPSKDYSNEKKCLKCHVTAYRQEGGFVDIESTPDLHGVGCEMCHGPGSKYRILHQEKRFGFEREEAKALGQVYGTDDPGVCEVCHTHNDSPFKDKAHKTYKDDWTEALKRSPIYHVK